MTYNERIEYGYRLRTMRLAAGLTAREVGKACGTTTRSVHYWETGERLPGIDLLRQLASVLKVPINQVVP